MKRNTLKIYAMLSLLIVLAVTTAQAQSNNQQTANIPFAFSVGQKLFPAGEYIIKRVNPASDKAALLIQSADGRVSAMAQTLPVEGGAVRETAKLVFNRYEDQYFLSQVWAAADSTGLELRASRAERTLAKTMKKGAPDRQTVALTSHRR